MKLLDTVRCLDLTDVWIDKHPQLNGYTWCNANDIPTSRIDYMFLSNEFMYKMDKILIRRVPGTHSNGTRMTDHRLLKLYIVVSEDKRGPGYWKLNVSYLDHEDYRKGIEHIVENLDETLSALEKWECFKRKVKDFSIYFARNTKKKTGLLIRQIENEISTLEDDPNIECNMNRKRLLEAQLDTLCNEKAKGAQIRSRYKSVTEGKKNTKYFLGLETKQQSYNVIRELKSDENGICTTQNDIMGEMCSFYEKLYTSKNINDVDIDDYLSNIEIPSLSSVDKEYCDEFPTLEECRDAVFNMKPNKSPGLDGLPSEFYKCMWDSIKTLFYNALKEIYDRNEMSFSQRLSVISLLYKKDDKKLLKNYRPLSLSNIDYKVIAFCFARRLQKILRKLISVEQSAYVKGRYIGENARTILDIFEYCENYDHDGILLFLDFEKAFDSVEWNFLFKTLKKFNFGNNFIKWMSILYTKPMFQIKNNGWISKTCQMTRGIRQGCPISAILYLFVAEILAIKIRSNNQIEGFLCPNLPKEIKSVQHADDLTLALKNIDSVEHAVETIDAFCRHAGSKINMTKTECILLGNLKGNFENINGIKVNTTVVKCLGIYIGHDKEECYNRNWMKVYHDMEKLFESWKRRKLTILGKCCIVNTLVLSKLIYVASLLPLPTDDFVKQINKLIYNFIWNSRDRIKRNVLINSIEKGGIGIVDVESKLKALKASWVTRIINKNSNIHEIVNSFLVEFNVDIDYLLNTSETKSSDFELVKGLPSFYQEVFVCFNACKKNMEYSHISSDSFLQQTIWCNKYVRYKGKALFLRTG